MEKLQIVWKVFREWWKPKKAITKFAMILGAWLLFVICYQHIKRDNAQSKWENIRTGETSESLPDLQILQKVYQPSYGAALVHVQVRNNTSSLMSYVQVNITFYDKNNNIVGTGMGNTSNLAGGATRTIDAIGMNIENCDHYDVDLQNPF